MKRSELDELEQRHKGWLSNPYTSRGQLDDSKSILCLIEMVRAVEAEREMWREEYHNVCRFATDFEAQRDMLREELGWYASEEPYRCAEADELNRQGGFFPYDANDWAIVNDRGQRARVALGIGDSDGKCKTEALCASCGADGDAQDQEHPQGDLRGLPATDDPQEQQAEG